MVVVCAVGIIMGAAQYSPASDEEASKVMVGTNTILFTPRQPTVENLDPGVISRENKKLGLVWYVRGDLRDVYTNSMPQPDELKTEAATFAAQGQCAALWFSVYALKDLNNLTVTVDGDLVNENAARLAGNTIQIKTVKAWYQMKTWTGTQCYHVPELLEERNLVDLVPCRNSQSFWLQTYIGENCAPGEYRGNIRLTYNKESLTIPMRIKILPFKLLTPDISKKWWGIYVMAKRFENMSVETMAREFSYLHDYGFCSLLMRIYVASTPFSFVKKDGKIVEFKSDYLERIQKARVLAGMKGPLVLWWYGILEERVAAEMGLKFERVENSKAGVWKVDLTNPELRQRIIEAFQAIDKLVKKHGGKEYGEWYYYGLDEPAFSDYSMKRVRMMCELAKAAGIPTADPCYGAAYETIQDVCDVQITTWGYRIENARKGQQWWSIDGGCYGGQEGGIMPDRFLSGFQFYKNGAQASVSWTYQSDFGPDPYDEAQNGSKPGNITYPPSPERGITNTLSTLQWEGIRAGIDDYRYCYTLEEYAFRCDAAGKKEPASAARNRLANVLKQLPGKEGKGFPDVLVERQYDNELIQKYRWMIASEILRMKKALESP